MNAYDRWLTTEPCETSDQADRRQAEYWERKMEYTSDIALFADALYQAINNQTAEMDADVLAAFNAGDRILLGNLLLPMISAQIDCEAEEYAERNKS